MLERPHAGKRSDRLIRSESSENDSIVGSRILLPGSDELCASKRESDTDNFGERKVETELDQLR